VIIGNDGNLNATAMGLSQPLTQYATGVRDREDLADVIYDISPLETPTVSMAVTALTR
jgi:hypothetical protein